MEQRKLIADLLIARDSPSKILEIFRAHGLDPRDLGDSVEEAPAPVPYSRRTLVSSPECEVMIARWSAGRACAPHDHGAAAGWVFFLEGRLEETAYRWNGRELLEKERVAREPGAVEAVRADEIHSGVSERGALTLHVYFPRIETFRVFDRAERRTLVVTEESGAWLPIGAAQIRKTIPWPIP